MMNSRIQYIAPHPRSGSLLPAYAIAILVAGGCLAWVLNLLWLSSTQEELRTLAQAVALSAAQSLASDELLKASPDGTLPAQAARERADEMLADDPLTRRALSSRQAPLLDLRLGRTTYDPSTGDQESEETDEFPTSALVISHRDENHQNPVQVFLPYLMGQPTANVNVTAEASISNRIKGLHPPAAAAVPAWPIGVLEKSADPRQPTWKRDIEERQGADNYAWDAKTREVLEEADGLTEITLVPRPKEGAGNAVIVDIGSQLRDDILQRQFHDGWRLEDLESFGGEFSLQGGPLPVDCTNDFTGMPQAELENQIGIPRIIVLYEPLKELNDQGVGKVKCVRLAAGRIMAVHSGEEGLQIVLQAAVVATRTAVLDEDALYQKDAVGNPYIYKLSVTQ
ncbi:hypothetical protein [Planctomicrobium sp. SH664]|uniref:hypothetical protein n=1 Tax=Planctomicrobium sp. SH664 TaxID=3448125 RepID=UPI003F5CA774